MPCASWTPSPIRSSAGCPIAGARGSGAGAASSCWPCRSQPCPASCCSGRRRSPARSTSPSGARHCRWASPATQLSYTAWGAELAGNYRERSRIAGFREAFTLVGTLIAIALPFAIGIEGGGLHGLAALGLTVAAGLFLFGGLAVANVPEPPEYTVSHVRIFEGLRHMAHNGPFVRLLAAYFINGLSNGIPATLFLYFVSEKLGAPDMRGPLLFTYFLAGLIGVPFAIKLAGRIGKHRAWCYAMLVNSALFALVPLLGKGDASGLPRSVSARG